MLYRKLLPVVCFCIISFLAPAQTFYKSLRLTDNSVSWHRIRKMINDGPDQFVVITTNHFYRIGSKGDILLQKRVDPGEYTLYSISRYANGNFCIAGTLNSSKLVRVWKTDMNGNILQQRDIAFSGEISEIRLVQGNAGHQYLACAIWGDDNAHAELLYLDEQLNAAWDLRFNHVLDKELCAIPGENGGVELQYCTRDDSRIIHHKVSSNKQITDVTVAYTPSSNLRGQIRRVIKTSDGGYLYAGVESHFYFNSDLVLVKTSNTGSIEWQVRKDLYLGDIDMGLVATGDGYLLSVITGSPLESTNYTTKDMAILKVDLHGRTAWCKAYGTVDADQATDLLLMNDGSIVLGGTASLRSADDDPVLIKTDAQGLVHENRFPYQVETPALLTLSPEEDRPLQNLIGTALLPDGGMILGTSIRDPETDVYYPYISRTDATGKIVWHMPTPDEGIGLTAMKGMTDGSFIAATTGLNSSHITRFGEDGKLIWTKEVKITAVQDIVQSPDGGYILCGHRQIQNQILLCVVLLNTNGDEQWTFTHQVNQQWISGRSVVVTPEGNILVTGFSQTEQEVFSDVMLAKINRKGNLLWYKTYPLSLSSATGNQVIVTSGNQYLITGFVRTYGGGEQVEQQVLLLQTNTEGALSWEKQYDLNKLDAGFRVLEHAGHFYVAGNTGRPWFGTREAYGFLMKTDLNGILRGVSFFGKQAAYITCASLQPGQQNKLIYCGTLQEPFDMTRPFRTELSMDVILTAGSPDNDKNVKMYPVPAAGNIFVEIDDSYTGQVRLSITDMSGKQVYQTVFAKDRRQVKIPVMLSRYPAGSYVAELIMGKRRVVRKLLIGKK